MSIKASIYGGIRIAGILPPKCQASYEGVWVEIRGTTFNDSKRQWENAGMTIEMGQRDAIDFALALILAAEKHGENNAKAVPLLIKRLNKRMARRKRE